MSDPYLDRLPSAEREKIRKRLRSPEAYEKLREKVKGPEDLEQEMNRSEKLAEAQFEMQTSEQAKEKMRSSVEQDIREKGIEAVLESIDGLSPDARQQMEQGKFTISVSSHPQTQEDALVAIPEGNVQEKLPVKPALSDRYVAQLLRQARE